MPSAPLTRPARRGDRHLRRSQREEKASSSPAAGTDPVQTSPDIGQHQPALPGTPQQVSASRNASALVGRSSSTTARSKSEIGRGWSGPPAMQQIVIRGPHSVQGQPMRGPVARHGTRRFAIACGRPWTPPRPALKRGLYRGTASAVGPQRDGEEDITSNAHQHIRYLAQAPAARLELRHFSTTRPKPGDPYARTDADRHYPVGGGQGVGVHPPIQRFRPPRWAWSGVEMEGVIRGAWTGPSRRHVETGLVARAAGGADARGGPG